GSTTPIARNAKTSPSTMCSPQVVSAFVGPSSARTAMTTSTAATPPTSAAALPPATSGTSVVNLPSAMYATIRANATGTPTANALDTRSVRASSGAAPSSGSSTLSAPPLAPVPPPGGRGTGGSPPPPPAPTPAAPGPRSSTTASGSAAAASARPKPPAREAPRSPRPGGLASRRAQLPRDPRPGDPQGARTGDPPRPRRRLGGCAGRRARGRRRKPGRGLPDVVVGRGR